jgi:hypothetical protein
MLSALGSGVYFFAPMAIEVDYKSVDLIQYCLFNEM